jgi:hypothetical protein
MLAVTAFLRGSGARLFMWSRDEASSTILAGYNPHSLTDWGKGQPHSDPSASLITARYSIVNKNIGQTADTTSDNNVGRMMRPWYYAKTCRQHAHFSLRHPQHPRRATS